MPTNLFSQKNTAIFVIVLLLILGGGYYIFTPSTSDSEIVNSQEVVKDVLSKNVLEYVNTKDKIDLKDSAFLSSVLYSELVDYSEFIDISAKRGRKNPFTPYVAPRSIR